ncbi:ErfK/YbiS/YcfS/YnhG family protein [Paenibacillus sp. TCA20]|uniref:L,D-transpeptidase family protein n=1 Tax=Paenibacillus sp. TCA20 TaxID=1499968 RepID=UPI0004D814B9|nr:L,D-transpeptidase [Paenibacillus sp. TCA20]GAK38652.1 ErfK/YbiS/YcfS/YnhG family protein [Paenibacillus sp. TCA20]
MRMPHDLKSYVQKHPDNQMAWYLLGKDYERSGQTAKANYCFERSGGIYEAFEHSKAPAQVWMEYQHKLMQLEQQRKKQQIKRKTAAILLWLLLLGLVPSAMAPDAMNIDVVTELAGESLPEQGLEIIDYSEEQGAAHESEAYEAGLEPPRFTGIPQINGEVTDEAAGKLMNQLRRTDASIITLGLEQENEFLIWGASTARPPVYQFHSNGEGTVTSQSLLPEWCKCTPEDLKNLSASAISWGQKEEQAIALRSAITAYKQLNGVYPARIEQLMKPFPNNHIGGVSSSMRELYPEMLDYMQSVTADYRDSEPDPIMGEQSSEDGPSLPSFEDTYGGEPYMKESLSIIVNKETHRLTLLSGNIVLRNYEVGLGGEKTPEGDFVISDKVVNPNGRADGEFGTRGMQLSDTDYAIHGTNEPGSIGLDESLGCIRMHQEDVEELFAFVPPGTRVTIKDSADTPTQIIAPEQAGDRFQPELVPGQTNPDKVYHWLN